MTELTGARVLDLVRAALEPVLLPRGFAPAQGGSSDGALEVTWCAGYDALAARFPGLPSAGRQRVDVGACVDVVLTARRDGTTWRLVSVELEGQDLASCLHHVGDGTAATRATALDGAALEPAVDALRELLDLLFVLGGAPTGVSPASPAAPHRR